METGANEKNFTDLTREELIEQTINFFDPDLCQHERLVALVNTDKEDAENMFSLKIREGNYYVSKFDWSYYNATNFNEAIWKQVSREEFRQYLYDSLSTQSLNELRLKYQVARKDKLLLEEHEETKRDYKRAMRLVKKMDVVMTMRINKTSDIPGDFTCVGNVLDSFDATFLEEHKFDPNVLIWQSVHNHLLLTAAVDKESNYIEVLALMKDDADYVTKKGESEKGLEAVLDKLRETLLDNETETE